MDTKKIIQEYYDENPQEEWERIGGRPEFILTCRYLDRYIKPGQRVLDIGGGPGRYSLYLAERGCDVTLVDLSSGNTEFALSQAKSQNIPLRAFAGDACKIDKLLPGECFDHVLLMGPLYHLLEESGRVESVEAALSLLKEGGTFYASFINIYAGLIFAMKFAPEIVTDQREQAFYQTIIKQQSFAGEAFTQAFFIQQSEILPFMARFPLKKLHFFAQEGISSPCEDNIMGQEPNIVNLWMDLCEQLCEREDLLSWGEHLMYVGQKQSLRLEFPAPEHEDRAMAYRQECFDAGEKMINGDAGFDEAESYSAWLQSIAEDLTCDVTPTHVPATAYFAMVGEKIVGTIQVRHCLNDYLLNYAGHIGYEVAPSMRRRGYASAMLSLALKKCQELGLDRALVTCNKENTASAATILSGGGILEDERAHDDGTLVQRYWCPVPEACHAAEL